MNRLRPAFLLLVALPALAFVALSVTVVVQSRSSLLPEIDRFAVARAAEYVRYYRASRTAEMPGAPEELEQYVSELGIERYSIYDDSGRRIEIFPSDAQPLSAGGGAERATSMFDATRRGQTVLDIVGVDGRPMWLAFLPGEERLGVVLRTVRPELTSRFLELTGYDLALYLGDSNAMASAADFAETLPAALNDSLVSLDRGIASELSGRPIAAAPLKDFDDWDVTGTVVVRAGGQAPTLPGLSVLPVLALVLASVVTVLIIWRLTLTAGEARSTSHLRRGFALALLPPALAAAWLASADARLSARATDATLEIAARSVGLATAEAPGTLPAVDLARLVGTDVVVVESGSVAEPSSPEVAEVHYSDLSTGPGRVRIAGRRWAYSVIEARGETQVILLTTPQEDSKKTALFWLAGLYGLLAVGLLVYASLASASGNALALREAKAAWSFVSPSLILLLLFSAAPLLFAFYLSFHRWNLLEPAKPFVGLAHYVDLAGDGLFWNAAKNTAIYSLYVPLTMVCALGVASLLNRRIKGVALLRAIFFLPYITSFVAISIVWQWMYDPDFGLFNWMLGLVGLGPYPWLNDPSTALLALILMAVWIHIGFQMIIFLAGLQAIPNELYEAAMIDGAGPWRRFRRITLPLLKPTTFFVLVTSIIGSFQVFTFVYVMTEGGPLHATDVIVYHIYQNAWQFLRMGYASAMSWVLFAVIFAITLLQFRFLGRRVEPS
jgi:ABC-type sugar transport system permease subunit